MNYLRSLILGLVLVFTCVAVHAQQNHFIYLQTENKQPFYVKMDKTIYNSTVSGYLIIPKLKEGNYKFLVGFINTSANGEQEFIATVARQDIGYIVKQFGEKGWGLFNLQTLQVTMAGAKEVRQDLSTTTPTIKTDDFSQMLSTVVNDPTIKYEQKEQVPGIKVIKDTLISKTPDEIETAKSTIISDSTKKQDDSLESNNDIARISAADNKATIIKGTQVMAKDGLNLIYIDSGEAGQIDTIAVLIPLEEERDLKIGTITRAPASSTKNETTIVIETKVEQEPNVDAKDKTHEKKISNKSDEVSQKNESAETRQDQKENKFLSIELPPGEPKKDTVLSTDKVNNGAVTGLIVSSNTSCVAYSNESDFLKLRKKMAAADGEDDMINIAKKAFKTKCYSTDQVKNLGVLFLNDAGRYNFFDLAYPHVYDTNNFNQLQSQLMDEYYKKRFKAMLRQ